MTSDEYLALPTSLNVHAIKDPLEIHGSIRIVKADDYGRGFFSVGIIVGQHETTILARSLDQVDTLVADLTAALAEARTEEITTEIAADTPELAAH